MVDRDPLVPRLASLSDMPAVTALVNAAYEKYLVRMDRPPGPMLRDYSGAIREGIVWLVGHPIIGVLVLQQQPDSLLIENIAVHPDGQGQGVGRALMDFAEQEAVRRRLGRITLYTHEVMVENLSFYAYLGYVEVGRKTEGYRRVFLEKRLERSER